MRAKPTSIRLSTAASSSARRVSSRRCCCVRGARASLGHPIGVYRPRNSQSRLFVSKIPEPVDRVYDGDVRAAVLARRLGSVRVRARLDRRRRWPAPVARRRPRDGDSTRPARGATRRRTSIRARCRRRLRSTVSTNTTLDTTTTTLPKLVITQSDGTTITVIHLSQFTVRAARHADGERNRRRVRRRRSRRRSTARSSRSPAATTRRTARACAAPTVSDSRARPAVAVVAAVVAARPRSAATAATATARKRAAQAREGQRRSRAR